MTAFIFRPIPSTASIMFRDCSIKFLEHVQVKVNLDFARRGDLSLQLKAPSGTTSPLTRRRAFDNLLGHRNLTDWVMTRTVTLKPAKDRTGKRQTVKAP